MQDPPSADEILASLRPSPLRPAAEAADDVTVYRARVAENLTELVRREQALAQASEPAEHARLIGLMGHPGDLPSLNQELCEALRRGALNLRSQGLHEHLWRTTMEKLAVDQPTYPAYRRAREAV